ncbi:Response regulator receiver domain-containing protein [Arsukibacterium tuosuense]|uniref:Response regulator receiver domain-containing protein n=1 Tax=Arsukibacterium tuosuense TaxID=1323745 RepID=A0A285JJ63_9GAMM|nr:response regulator [Arsukibacterium tuosuense]SNY60342.1 Response regulator receiver domain-containing protein [Arsukibacterium tuosuense]
MPIPVTIADDSLMSRKAVRRALPPEWDVDITEACNGKEALLAVESGKAEVLFLDLTMPELDGFGVLQYLHEHHAKTVVIVISADIQPEAKRLVDALGAFRFLHKPLQAQQLRETLFEVGLI